MIKNIPKNLVTKTIFIYFFKTTELPILLSIQRLLRLKIKHFTNQVTGTAANLKVTESENKTLAITSLVTTSDLNTITKEIENKIPDVSGLLTKSILDLQDLLNQI